MKMMATCDEIRSDIRDELLCPVEYLRHLTRFGVIRELKAIINADEFDRDVRDQFMDEIRDGYAGYCDGTGLTYGDDNRKAHPHWFTYLYA